jgi:hypothetical protein
MNNETGFFKVEAMRTVSRIVAREKAKALKVEA